MMAEYLIRVPPQYFDLAVRALNHHLTRTPDKVYAGVEFQLPDGQVLCFTTEVKGGRHTVWMSDMEDHKNETKTTA